jgi:hypothetical protein
MFNLDKVNYRLLSNEEFKREDVISIFEENGFIELDPFLNKILVAEYENKIIGMVCARPVFHIEPWWIHPDYRSSLLVVRLGKRIMNLYDKFKGLTLYTFSHREEITKALSKGGFQEMPFTVLRHKIGEGDK